MPLTKNLTPPSVASEFGMAVGWGLAKGYTRVAAFGYNPDVDGATLPEDIWVGGGLYPWMTASTALEIISTSANDASAGTGARTVLVSGLDINYVAVTQLVTLNGTTPVALATPLFRVNSLLIMSAGSGQVNAGQINVRDISGGTIRSIIAVGAGISQQSAYTVPAGFTLQVISNYTAITGNGSTRTADVSTMFRSPLGFYRLPLTLTASDGHPYRHDASPGIIVAEKTDFSMRCINVSNDNSAIVAAWLGILRANT
jgi:hypothetical protein